MDSMRFHKTAALVLGLLLAMAVLTPAIAQQNGQAEVMLQAAQNKQLVDGDLAQAIQMYKKILSEYSADRPVAAKALVEMGDCYEKLGKSEALKAYQRVLHDYADQSAEANEARARLAALEHGGAHSKELVTRRVWAGPEVGDEGAPSPDGKYLSYVDWNTGDLAIYDLATGVTRRVTHKGTWAESSEEAAASIPSPDGKQIAYAWFNTDNALELRTIGIDGSHPRTVYRNASVDYIELKAWSPGGRQVLAIFYMKDDSSELAMVTVADGSVRVLKKLEPGPYEFSTMGFSPDGRYIAYTLPRKDDPNHNDIFLLSVDGSREIPLVIYPADDVFLGWAPDGKTVLFGSDRTGTFGAWTIEVLDGKPHGSPSLVKSDIGRINPLGFTRNGSFYYSLNNGVRDLYSAAFDFDSGKRLTSPHAVSERFTGANAAPAWSPDGKYLAYLSRRHSLRAQHSGADTIVVRSLTSGDEREIVPKLLSMNPFLGLQWSPDERFFLVYGMGRDGRAGIFRVDAQTSETSIVFRRSADEFFGFFRITPDGKALVYLGGPKSPQMRIRDFKTGQLREIPGVKPSVFPSGLALSPDGSQIAFDTQVYHGDMPALEIVPIAGGEPRVLYRLKRPADFAWNTLVWTSDGKHLVFGVIPGGMVAGRQTADLWEIAVDGGEPRKLDVTGDTLRHLRISPDGHHVAFESGARSFEIDVIENLLPTLKASR
jgi:Tol biopolymer transport system component